MEPKKLYDTLTFERSDIWDAALFIIDELQKSKNDVALDGNLTPDQRSYACGQSAALVEAIALLKDTHVAVRERANMKSN